MMLLYSRYYLVLSLLSVIGLALPSDDGASVTTRKLAKGSKKNSSMLFQEEIPVYDTDVRPAWWWDSPEGYPYVQIKNDTPYDVSGSDGWDVGRLFDVYVYYLDYWCSRDHDIHLTEGIASGDTWTAKSRGRCKVLKIDAYLTLSNGSKLKCAHYHKYYGTTDYLFSIIMDGVDRCFVRSRHDETQPGSTYVKLKNDTPYAVAPTSRKAMANVYVRYSRGSSFYIDPNYEGIAPGDTWTKKVNGPFKVEEISAYLTLPDASRLWCATYYVKNSTTGFLFFIIMDDVDCCSVQSSDDDTMLCAGNYGSSVPVSHQCPQSKPNCVNYVHNKHWGTCEKDPDTVQECAANYGSKFPCCGQIIYYTGTVGSFQCPQSKPICVNYAYNDHWGTCEKGPDTVQVKNDTPYAVARRVGRLPGERLANVWVGYTTCTPHYNYYNTEGIAPGDTWTAPLRGRCTVGGIYAYLTLPDDIQLECTEYVPAGTYDSLFFIIMDGDDHCCVRSSQDDTPTMRCAGDYSSNVPGQEGTPPTVPWVLQCPQSKPSCVNYVYNDHMGVSLGTCVATCVKGST